MAATGKEKTIMPEPPLYLGSPRVRAAMKVLGIIPEDLQKKSLEDYDGKESRLQLFENKRRNLINDIIIMAERSPDANQVAYHTDKSANASFMEKVLEAEQKNMTKAALMAKKDVQKIVLEELEAKLVMHHGSKKMAESEARLKRLHKAREDKIALTRKEAQKRADKSADARNRATEAQEEEAREMMEKLTAANKRAEDKLSTIAEQHEESRLKGQDRTAMIADRTAKLRQSEIKQRERQYDGIVAKHEAKMDKLAESLMARQSQSEAILQKQQESMERVRNQMEKKERETKERFGEIVGRHETAKKKRDSTAADLAKELRVRNTKERNAFEGRWERIQQELESYPNVSRRLQSMGSEPFERSLSDSQISALDMRVHHTDLVAANRERLRRAHQHSQEKQLEKLDGMRERVEIMMDSKASADRRRTSMIKNCAAQKCHLEDEVDKVKSAPAKKMLKLLQELDPEPEAAARIKDILEEMGLQTAAAETEER